METDSAIALLTDGLSTPPRCLSLLRPSQSSRIHILAPMQLRLSCHLRRLHTGPFDARVAFNVGNVQTNIAFLRQATDSTGES